MHPIREQYYEQMKELSMACNRVAELGYVTSHGGNLSMRVADDGVGHALRQEDGLAVVARLLRRAVLGTDVDDAGGIVPHPHHAQAGAEGQDLDAIRQAGADAGADGLPVQEVRRHLRPPGARGRGRR